MVDSGEFQEAHGIAEGFTDKIEDLPVDPVPANADEFSRVPGLRLEDWRES